MGDSSTEIDNERDILDVAVDRGKRKTYLAGGDRGKTRGWAQDGGDSWGKSKDSTSRLLV